MTYLQERMVVEVAAEHPCIDLDFIRIWVVNEPTRPTRCAELIVGSVYKYQRFL